MNGLELRDLRRKAGLFQAEVAEYLEVDKQTMSRWERFGKRIPRPVEFAFYDLVYREGLIDEIKSKRKPRIYGRPFQKRI